MHVLIRSISHAAVSLDLWSFLQVIRDASTGITQSPFLPTAAGVVAVVVVTVVVVVAMGVVVVAVVVTVVVGVAVVVVVVVSSSPEGN